MTENDKRLIAEARNIRSDYMRVARLMERADTDEARRILSDLEERAFRTHERIAFESYD